MVAKSSSFGVGCTPPLGNKQYVSVLIELFLKTGSMHFSLIYHFTVFAAGGGGTDPRKVWVGSDWAKKNKLYL